MHIMEMDVQLTRDKQVVVHHDPMLSRLTGVERRVSEMDYDEIPKVMEETQQHFGFAKYNLKPGIGKLLSFIGYR